MANNQLREDLILNTSQFDAKIVSINSKIDELSKKGKKMGGGFTDSIGNMVGSVSKFDSKMMGAISTLGKFAGVAGGLAAGVSLADWFANTTAKAVELATEAEGVRLAFARLNKPDLLDELNRATHNTVSNLELMKQAVKFKDFNLDISQMGTYLAFAQQKAKDTGQSVDYLVDSIVTGLGRQSLQILDNLGLSAAEIKNEMKKGGDMTKAVAEIIKKKMAESGDYIETAADRAARREKELDDALEELGRNFTAGQGAAGDFFHTIEMGAISALNWLGKLINKLSEAGRLTNTLNERGDAPIDDLIKELEDTKGDKSVYKNRVKEFNTWINGLEKYITDLDMVRNGNATEKTLKRITDFQNTNGFKTREQAEDALNLAKRDKSMYVSRASSILNPSNSTTQTTTGKTGKKDKVYPEGSVGWLDQQISKLKEKVKVSVDVTEIRKLNQEIANLTRKRDNLEAGWTPKNLSLSDMNLGKMSLTQAPKPLSQVNKNLPNITAGTIYDYYNSKKDSINNVMETLDMGLIGKEQAQEYIDAINAELESLGLKPIKVKVEADGVEKAMHGIESIGSALSSMGSALEMPELDVLGTIGQAIATVALGYSKATEQAASLGPWAWIAFAAAGLAQMMTVIASIKSATSGYANGGIIGGSSYAGDNLIARVNSGEMILNSQQQRNLFNLLDNGGGIGGAGQVEFVLKGSDLYGSMRNYSRVKSLSGINTGIK